MIIVISIGGSVLISTLDSNRIQEYAASVKQLAQNHSVYVVTGGGSIARDYISAARSMGANEVECDIIGIDMTRVNARLLITALGSSAYPEPPTRYQDALHAARSGRIVVMGGMMKVLTVMGARHASRALGPGPERCRCPLPSFRDVGIPRAQPR